MTTLAHVVTLSGWYFANVNLSTISNTFTTFVVSSGVAQLCRRLGAKHVVLKNSRSLGYLERYANVSRHSMISSLRGTRGSVAGLRWSWLIRREGSWGRGRWYSGGW